MSTPTSPRRRLPMLVALLAVLAVVAAACGSDDTSTEAGSDASDPSDESDASDESDDNNAGDGAGDGGDAASGGTRAWIAGSWVLQSATGPDGPLALPPVELDLTITGPDQVEGNAGCNSFGGTISAPFDDDADAGPLTLDELFITEMACEYLDVELAYVDLLTSVDRWELAPPSGLIFRGEGVELVYGIGAAPAEVPLEQTLWVFDTIFDGEGVERTASSTRSDKPEVTATFAGGVLTVEADDCGPIEIAVTYEPGAADGPLAVADGTEPVADCDDPESNLVAAIDGIVAASGFQIFDGRLTLIGLPGETVSFRASDG